jgi:hypothetical protein
MIRREVSRRLVPLALLASLAVPIKAANAQTTTTDSPSHQGVSGFVVLKDGTILAGKVLESVIDDHITMRLPSGETKRLEWSRIAKVLTSDSSSWTQTFDGRFPTDGASPRPVQPPPWSGGSEHPEHTADWPEPDRTAGPYMSSRFSMGLQSGYLSPLGVIGAKLALYPTSFFGLEAGYGWHGSGGPTTFTESMVFEWPMGWIIGQGLGIGLAQSRVSHGADDAPLASPGYVQFLTGDVTHVSFYLSRALTLRLTGEIAFPIKGASVCGGKPFSDVCGAGALSGNVALFWNFDLSRSQE